MQTCAKIVLYARVYFVVPLKLGVGLIVRYEKVKEGEKMQPSVSTALQAILADRGYKVLELKTFSGATFVGTNIQIKFNEFLLTKCVYCNDELFSTIQNISEVRILFFS